MHISPLLVGIQFNNQHFETFLKIFWSLFAGFEINFTFFQIKMLNFKLPRFFFGPKIGIIC